MPSVLNTAITTGPGFQQQINAVRDVFSAEIWFAALPTLRFDQFTVRKTELGTQPGRTIQMPRFGNLKRGGKLIEGVRVRTRGMSMTLQPISITENGNAVGFSEMLFQTSFYDQLAAASLLLGRDMALVLDQQLRDGIMGALSTIFSRQKMSRASLIQGDVFDTQMVKDMVEVLETNNVPKWGGDHYICFLHPHQARGLRDDNEWINAALYSGAGQIYTGEIGRYADVRFITTTVMPNGSNNAVDPFTDDYVDAGFNALLRVGTGGNQTNIYQSVMFGEYALAHATGLPVELRDNGVEDFGREHALMWYAIWGQGILESQNIVVGESA
jgi:N4-gp56 family major capsid protein